MQHVYRLDEAATTIVATAADIARSTLARHAAEVDANARYPEETRQPRFDERGAKQGGRRDT